MNIFMNMECVLLIQLQKIHFSLSILLLSFLWFLRRFEIEPGFVKFCTLCRKLHYWDILVFIGIGKKKEL